MQTRKHCTIRLAAVALGVGVALPASAAEDWDWYVAPYLWASSITADLSDSRATGSTEVEFSDIVDKLEGAFQIHTEGQNDHFGILFDFTWMSVGDDKEFERFDADSSIDTVMVDLAGVWSPGDGRYEGFELLAGLRYLSMDVDVDIDPFNQALPDGGAGFDTSFTDFLVGARYLGKFSERWGGSLRGDVSGGDTEGTWSVAGTVTYKTKSGGMWAFGWRHMDMEFQPQGRKLDQTLSGPIVGYAMHF